MNIRLKEAVCSGVVRSAEHTQELLAETAELVRSRGYEGYLHVKVMPGAPRSLVKRAAEESAASGATTQLIVGGAWETDREVYDETARLYERHGLRRVYFSPFRPVPGTGMADREAADRDRGARLYGLDWIRRVYGFSEDEMELAFDGEEAAEEPKLRIAERTGLRVDPEAAREEELLRLPGVGPVRARRVRCGRDASRTGGTGSSSGRRSPSYRGRPVSAASRSRSGGQPNRTSVRPFTSKHGKDFKSSSLKGNA